MITDPPEARLGGRCSHWAMFLFSPPAVSHTPFLLI